jgi:hypothetical protein
MILASQRVSLPRMLGKEEIVTSLIIQVVLDQCEILIRYMFL